jgi:5S rRNA maturation endonuclease (ribonuclease M5)
MLLLHQNPTSKNAYKSTCRIFTVHKLHIHMNDQKSLRKVLDKISSYAYPIIVEGKKDAARLRLLGITNDIYVVKGPLYEFCTMLSNKHKNVIILTDFDQGGKLLAAKLAGFFQPLGVQTDLRLRRELFAVAKQKTVESLKEVDENGKARTERGKI